MDEQVRLAMARWPDVPDVHGWLRLDRRGHWFLVERGKPGFDEARDGAGGEITSEQIRDFIGRNYDSDAQGRWYWQNGPQRVFVDLDRAPLIYRVVERDGVTALATHTDYPADQPRAFATSDDGDLFVLTEHGPGLVHDLDLALLDFEENETRIDADAAAGARGADDARTAGTVLLGGRRHLVGRDRSGWPTFQRRPRP
jgi:hypothetical protein